MTQRVIILITHCVITDSTSPNGHARESDYTKESDNERDDQEDGGLG